MEKAKRIINRQKRYGVIEHAKNNSVDVAHGLGRCNFMTWYNDMTVQQKKDFKKVIAISVIGAIIVLLIPIAFHFV